MKTLHQFLNDDSGAVTVDWVVLTAAIVGIAIAVIALISGGIKDASGDISDTVTKSAGHENSNIVLGLEGTGVVDGDGTEIFRSPEGRLSLGAGGEPMTTADFEGDIRNTYDYSDTSITNTSSDPETGFTTDTYTTTTTTVSEVYDSTVNDGAGEYVTVTSSVDTTTTETYPSEP